MAAAIAIRPMALRAIVGEELLANRLGLWLVGERIDASPVFVWHAMQPFTFKLAGRSHLSPGAQQHRNSESQNREL